MEWIEEIFAEGDSFVALLAPSEGAEIVTGLLFSLGAHISGKRGCVTLIEPQPPVKAPLLPSGWQPHVNNLRRVEFLYMSDRRELVTFVTTLHALGAVPDCIMVDGLNNYVSDNENCNVAAMLALLEDLSQWIRTKRKQENAIPVAPVVVSFMGPPEHLDQTASILTLYTDQVWRLLVDRDDPSWFNLKYSENGRLRVRVNDDGTTFDWSKWKNGTTTDGNESLESESVQGKLRFGSLAFCKVNLTEVTITVNKRGTIMEGGGEK